MARSIEISSKKGTNISIGTDGTGNTPLEFNITVDGVKDSTSFTVSGHNDYWFHYFVKRYNGQTVLAVTIDKNFSTYERNGSITVQHNCAKISKTITLYQEAIEYSISPSIHYHAFKTVPSKVYEECSVEITAKSGTEKWYVKDIEQYTVGAADDFVDKNYKGLPSQNKAMSQTYTTYDRVFNYRIEGNNLIVRSYGQIDLISKIAQYAKSTQKNAHTRYFFVISHSDVNNKNRRYMDEKTNYQEDYGENYKRYEDKILFVFDDSNGSGSGYGEDDSPTSSTITPPSEGKNYIFSINNSSSPIINVEAGTDEISVIITIISTLNGDEQGYNSTIDSETEKWCAIDGNNIKIKPNEDFAARQGTIVFTQNDSKKTITLTIAQLGQSKSYIFTVLPNTNNWYRTTEEFNIDDMTYSANSVVSEVVYNSFAEDYKTKCILNEEPFTDNFDLIVEAGESNITFELIVNSLYGTADTPYTLTDAKNCSWITTNTTSGKTNITLNKNDEHSLREMTYAIQQTNSRKIIYMNVRQKSSADANEFDVKFENYSESAITVDYSEQTIFVKVTSTHNGVYKPFTTKLQYWDSTIEGEDKWVDYTPKEGDDVNNWITYSETKSSIIVNEYLFKNKRTYNDGKDAENPYSTTARIVFTREDIQDEDEKNKYLTITQKRQMVDIVLTTEDSITVGYEGKHYDEPFARVYSYFESEGEKEAVELDKTKFEIVDGDFIILEGIEVSKVQKDEEGKPYYKVSVTVETNENEEIRKGYFKVVNTYGNEIVVEVEQRKNGEIVLTSFDYIVMNYNWKDFYGKIEGSEEDQVYCRDFDSVMYFDTKSIGNMYQKTAYYSSKLITDTIIDGTTMTFGELAYDQASISTKEDLDRIETQVVYLLNLQENGFLQQIKEASDKYLTIQLYGIMYNEINAKATPDYNNVTLSIHTYKGGTMEKDDTNKTMTNVGGEEVNIDAIPPVEYVITKYGGISGKDVETLQKSFQHLGKIEYNVKDKSAVFTPSN